MPDSQNSLGEVDNASLTPPGHLQRWWWVTGDCASNGFSGPTRRAEVRRGWTL